MDNNYKKFKKLEKQEEKDIDRVANGIVFIFSIIGTIASGVTTYFLFNWFIVETFDITKISFLSALGIYTLFNFFSERIKASDCIIKDAKIHQAVIEAVVNMANGLGFSTLGLTSSPIKGGHGNIEFLLHLSKARDVLDQVTPQIQKVVAEAHGELDEKK